MPPTVHHPNGASVIYRRSICPGSREMERGKPDHQSDAAKDGQLTHLAAECARLNKPMPEGITPSARGRVQEWLDWLPDPADPSLIAEFVEMQLDLSDYIVEGPDGEAPLTTADYVGVIQLEEGVRITVRDLKDGNGWVSIGDEDEPNMQLATLAVAALDELDMIYDDIVEVEVGIGQPKRENWPLLILSPAQIRDFAVRLAAIDDATYEEIENRNPDEDACRFCRGRQDCPEFKEWVAQSEQDAEFEFDPDAPGLQLAQELDRIDAAIKRLGMLRSALVDEATFRLELDDEVPGWTLKTSLGWAKWIDETKAERRLRSVKGLKIDEYKPRRLVTPAQGKKLLKKHGVEDPEAFLSKYNRRPEKGTTLTRDTSSLPDAEMAEFDTVD